MSGFARLGLLSQSGLYGLMLSACGSGRDISPVVVRDSGNVEIIDIDRDNTPIGPSISSQPEWVISDADGLPLYGIADALYSDDGVVLIAEASTQQLIRVDIQSGESTRWGGAGDGPAEFRGLSGVFRTNERQIAAFDRIRRRYVTFDDSLRLIGESQLPDVNAAGSSLRLLAPVTGPMFLAAITNFAHDQRQGVYRGSAPLIRLNQPIDTVAFLNGRSTFSESGVIGGVIFGYTTLVSAGANGIWTGDTSDQEIRLWTDQNVPHTIIRWSSSAPRLVTARRSRELWDRIGAALPSEQKGQLKEMQDRMVLADTLPAFGSLVGTPSGAVWIGSPIPPERNLLDEPWPEQEWLVIHPERRTAWRLTTPPGLRVIQAGDDFVMGVHQDDLGVESLRLYKISSPDT